MMVRELVPTPPPHLVPTLLRGNAYGAAHDSAGVEYGMGSHGGPWEPVQVVEHGIDSLGRPWEPGYVPARRYIRRLMYG